MAEDETRRGILREEERELRRVFDYMCNYAPLSRVYRQLNPLKERLTKLKAFRKSPDAVKVYDSEGNVMTEEQVNEEFEMVVAKIDELEEEIRRYDTPDKMIRVEDLAEILRSLGKRVTRKEVEDIIWEVDENLDNKVDWEEFVMMFERNITDRTGLEPFQLFNVVQFMMYDKDYSGTVTLDETMSMLYARYGRDRLDSQMHALFGDDLRTPSGDGTLTLSEYLKAVSVRMPPKSRIGKKGSRKNRK